MRTCQIAALVPMRHHSERVPEKNYRLFAGAPLYHYIVRSLQKCPRITAIYIDTDSPVLAQDIEKNFPEAVIIDRPESLTADNVPMNDIISHDISQMESEFFLQTHSTNPLLKPESVSRAIEQFFNNYPSYDCLFSVTRIQSRLWDSLARPINHNSNILLRTQDLPLIYQENSCMYIFSKEIFQNRQNRIGHRPFMFEIDPIEAWDIDEEIDFRVAEILYKEEHYSETSSVTKGRYSRKKA